ncbi:MAG: SDR family NAD(P)-dependent oxidoreductase [Acidimicrobiia bacterium]|nr:SDR family NAD(P)-dependent oxidoreductase [Acidimicrobiia bacterium]MYC45253.1 SDR family NAD(P)-dependent oxidoreductase [Acidimicrobiia bacterium]MYI19344.1 SDR family NAD(P)-dependent oxidoreductase [Acidimicrobiia bacterium]
MGKVVLITGASSGIGREAAILMARKGHTVYAGARRADRLAELADHGVIPVQMDVSESADNERVVDQIIRNEGRIDVLINNAGFGLYGPIEDIPIDDARYQFEVNLFGLAHLTQLVLPHMRAQGAGRIVNISSMVGKVFMPLAAWYDATKHALEGWSDCLRYETAPFGIQVVLIEPGAIKTEFDDVRMAQLETLPADSAYRSQIDTFKMLVDDPPDLDRQTPPEVVARVYAKAATTRRPRRRYVTGKYARSWMFVRRWLGDGAYELILRRAYR